MRKRNNEPKDLCAHKVAINVTASLTKGNTKAVRATMESHSQVASSDAKIAQTNQTLFHSESEVNLLELNGSYWVTYAF